MTSTAHSTRRRRPVTATASTPVLGRAVEALLAKKKADLDLLVAATEWAEANPGGAGPGADAAGWGDPEDLFGEGFLSLAGDGTPRVAEFAPVELGAGLGWTAVGAQLLMGDGLELKYRLPRLWSLLVELKVPVHLAREVAAHTKVLSYDAARWADRLVSADPTHLDRVKAEALVREARLFYEPDLVVAEEENALAARRVDLHRGLTPATTEVVMTLDTPDAVAFDRAVGQTAETLRQLGDGDALDLRRAKAVGVLADPQRALDLLTTGVNPVRARASSPVGPGAVLWLHLDETALLDLDTFPAAVMVEGLGTVSSGLLRAWLAETTVTVRPVLDLRRAGAADGPRPAGVDGRSGPAPRPPLRLPRLPKTVASLRPRPHRRLRRDVRRWTTRPDDPGEPGTTVSTPSPRQDAHHLALPTPARRLVPLDLTYLPHLCRPAP